MNNDGQNRGIEYAVTSVSHHDRAETIQPERCPSTIFVLALLQICRGVFIAAVILISYLRPDTAITSKLEVKIATFIIARQNLTSPVYIITLPLAAAYFCITGFGLLRLKMWAKNVLMLSSAATVLLWARRFLFDYALERSTLKTNLQQQSIYAVMCVDAIIFLSLAVHVEAFKK